MRFSRNNIAAGQPGGFTLIESLLALILLTVGVLTVVQGYSLCLKGQRDADAYTLAVWLAQKRLEEIRTGPAPLEAETAGTFMETDLDLEFEGYGLAGSEYTWAAQFTPEELDGLVRIELTVSWPGLSQARSETFTLLHYWPSTQESAPEASS